MEEDKKKCNKEEGWRRQRKKERRWWYGSPCSLGGKQEAGTKGQRVTGHKKTEQNGRKGVVEAEAASIFFFHLN